MFVFSQRKDEKNEQKINQKKKKKGNDKRKNKEPDKSKQISNQQGPNKLLKSSKRKSNFTGERTSSTGSFIQLGYMVIFVAGTVSS